MMTASKDSSGVLHVGFNQVCSLFSVGTNSGFQVWSCNPIAERFKRFDNGGIGIVEMLFETNILALVGGGTEPRYPPSKVMIWDDLQQKCIGELSFRSQVVAVRLKRDKVVVALEQKVLVYNFADLKLLEQYVTVPNPRGLVALSSAPESTVLACPGQIPGQVRIALYDTRKIHFLIAHDSPLSCLSLSQCGKRLATASEKGTLVRVWNTADGQLLKELRRGANPACIHSLAFSKQFEWLAVSSHKGTVHVFNLREEDEEGLVSTGSTVRTSSTRITGNANGESDNGADWNAISRLDKTMSLPPGEAGTQGSRAPTGAASLLGMVKGLVPAAALPKYLRSQWSWAQFRVPTSEEGCRLVVGFGSTPNSLLILTSGGSFYRVSFDLTKKGPCVQEHFIRVMEPKPGLTV